MADSPTTTAKATSAESANVKKSCCRWTDWTRAAILLRLVAGLLLLLSGTDKFKSATTPCTYSLDNYYGSDEELKNPDWNPKMTKIVKVVFDNSGLNNPVNYPKIPFIDTALNQVIATKLATTTAWSFHYFGYALPWMMIGSGLMILLGLFSRIGYFIGGFVWISLIAGQLLLPDPGTITILLNFFIVTVAAMALQTHNRVRVHCR